MNKVLLTGGAGFIGSNILGNLLDNGYHVKCIDNLSTGSVDNIGRFLSSPNFEFIEADITDYSRVLQASEGVDFILHQAALGSVPRSINDPITTNRVNVEGTLNVFYAAVTNNIKRVVYAASSSTYGDSPNLPKVEHTIGNPLSPYAVTKLVNEMYADVFYRVYGLKSIGLRYFNVFGPNQNPEGPYAAVIPAFIQAFLSKEAPHMNGDGTQSRDFTFVDNVVQANMKAMLSEKEIANDVFNIACGEVTSLNELVDQLREISSVDVSAIYGPERSGDVKHSLADISKAKEFLNYSPSVSIKEGLKITYEWFKNNS